MEHRTKFSLKSDLIIRLVSFAVVMFLFILPPLPAQTLPPVTNGWVLFSNVKFTPQYYEEFKDYFLAPFFDSKIRQYDSHEIVLKGHYMPIDLEDKNVIILSKYPYAACFFCGGAGPESVAEIRFKEKPPRFKADQIIQVTGKLKLNEKDVNYLNFILTEAVLIGQ